MELPRISGSPHMTGIWDKETQKNCVPCVSPDHLTGKNAVAASKAVYKLIT
jgi:hypothetical protein